MAGNPHKPYESGENGHMDSAHLSAQHPEAGRPTPARRLLRLACGLAVFLLFGYLGRATIIDRNSVALVWPAGGVAALWLASGNRQTWPGDLAVLAVASFTVNATTGATVPTALAFMVSNLLQVGAYVFLARRWTEAVWGLGGTEPLNRLSDLGRLVIASVAASFVGATTGALGLWMTADGTDASSFVVWWGRNGVSLVVITVLGLVAGRPLVTARSPRELGRILYDAVHARTLGRLVEAELLIASSIGLYALVFGEQGAAPLSFLVLAVSVWAGLRFSPTAVMAHGVATGVAGLVFTLHGTGPFAGIESPHFRALVAQVFVATTVLTGLALALSRVERDNATRRLALARREADERARLLGAVLESMNEGLVVVEDGGRVLVSNAASRSLMGLDELRSQVRRAEEYALFREDGTPVTDDELPGTRALAGEEVAPSDFHLRAASVPDGRVLEISARPVNPPDTDDRPLAMINIRDVTLDRQHRDALASFAGVVAHDLFNPLTIVTGWAEALEEEFDEGSVQPSVGLPMVARVHEAASHMRDVIGDLLAYTIARDQSLRPVAVDLTAEVRALGLLRIDGPGNPLITVSPGLQVWADAGLVRQLFDNLLGNAVKYVAPGVRPRVDIRGRRDGDWLEVRVTDNGIGIPEEQRELVFETFHRAHDSAYQGTGLGLAICRRIADRHGGSIHAEAGPHGIGTAFVVRLPSTSAGFASDPSLPRPVVRQPSGERQSV
jgi:signal transduction histidine kinase